MEDERARYVVYDNGTVSQHVNEATGALSIGPSKVIALGNAAGSRVYRVDNWPEMVHSCIALGEGAIATESYQLVLRVRLTPGRPPVQLETIMTPEEHEVVSRVVRRLVEHPATPSFPQES